MSQVIYYLYIYGPSASSPIPGLREKRDAILEMSAEKKKKKGDKNRPRKAKAKDLDFNSG